MEVKLKKFAIALMVFMLMFSHIAFTLEAVAATDEFKIISNGIFRKDEIKFNAYFVDEKGKKVNENISDVNQNIRLMVEITPQVEGYLKEGVIKAVDEGGGSPNFRFVKPKDMSVDELDMQTSLNTNKLKSVKTSTNTTLDDAANNTTTGTEDSNTSSENTAEDEDLETATTIDSGETELVDEKATEESTDEEEVVNEEELIEQVINETEEETAVSIEDVEIISDTEIRISNQIEAKTIEIDLEFEQNTLINIDDLYKIIKLQLSGTYINTNLEEVEIGKEQTVKVGWKYTRDIKVSSEYTKFSPFKIGEKEGTIVENDIVIKRETIENKYLPIKRSKIEIKVPEVNGEKPEQVNVQAAKLLATRGEDIGGVQFTEDNWEYNKEIGTITIEVFNGERNWNYAVNSMGDDAYIVTYRYAKYTEDENKELTKDIKVEVEEYSGKENNIIRKELKDSQEIEVNIGELITYSIGTTEFPINKGKINANYNSDEEVYETTYMSTVNVNILTSDMLEEFTIRANQENYIDYNGSAFENKDVKYKEVRFNYNDTKTILGADGVIEIYNTEGTLLNEIKNSEVMSQDDVNILIDNASGLEIKLKNVNSNGNLKIDLIKAIGKCSYDKTAFKNFTELESRVTGEIKYAETDEAIELQEIGTRKLFKESNTAANISINKNSLSTMEENTDVEIKIELNNNKETSDLYVDPCFEIVFPKYVTEVTVENINLFSADGLSIGRFETYKEYDIVKLRIQLEGKQTHFSDTEATNGTNVIANVRIKLNEYTPRKQDQIKLYYYNEGVTNYESQTKWTVGKPAPAGIIRQTNGIDITTVNYKAPSGLVAINGIKNYDGKLGEVRSIKQGEMIRKISRKSESQISTMEVLALNNTGNMCTEVVLLGRVPFKGNQDILTGQDLGTTTGVAMKDTIKADVQNSNAVRIYYSTNEHATKDLANSSNEWTTAPANISEVKSYLISVNEQVEPGAVLRFTYEFEIPADLPYESSMYGSFGGYYNNNTEVARVYESTVADKVGLVTESGPKVEANMTVDIGDNTPVQEARFMEYTITVANSGSVAAEGITITNELPRYTTLYEYEPLVPTGGDNNYYPNTATKKEGYIERLEQGEVKQFKYTVKTRELPTLEQYYYPIYGEILEDESGKYYEEATENDEKEKIYLPEGLPDVYITNKATVKVSNLAIETETNETKNLLTKANFDFQVYDRAYGIQGEGGIFEIFGSVQNISKTDLQNVLIELKLPDTLKYVRSDISGISEDIIYNEQTNTIYAQIDNFRNGESLTAYIVVEVVKGDLIPQIMYFQARTGSGPIEKSMNMTALYKGGNLKIDQRTSAISGTVLEGNDVEFIITLNNIGNGSASNVVIQNRISENLINPTARLSGAVTGSVSIENGEINHTIPSIGDGRQTYLTIRGKAANLNNTQKTISNQAKVIYKGEQETNLINVGIQQNPNKPDNTNNNVNTNTNTTNTNTNTTNTTNTNNTTTNSTTNQTSNNSNNQNDNQNNNTTKTEEKKSLSISGTVWIDENRDGRRDSEEKVESGVVVSLLKGKTTVKTITTNSSGDYRFDELSAGDYSVEFKYDKEQYISTTYKKQNVEENLVSQAVGNADGKAVTNTITLKDLNVENVNLGIQYKEKVAFEIEKVITGATVTNVKNSKKDEKHSFDNLSLAKFEIASKELKNSVVKLQYKVLVKNTGNIESKIDQITDILPKDTSINEKENSGWYIGSDGNIYNDSLKNTDIKVGETKELVLTVTKQMTNENTGVVSNKVMAKGINNTFNINANQETIISIKTGKTVQILTMIIMLFGIYLITYKKLKGKIQIDLSKLKDIKIDWDKINIKDKFNFSYKNERK